MYWEIFELLFTRRCIRATNTRRDVVLLKFYYKIPPHVAQGIRLISTQLPPNISPPEIRTQ